METGGDMSVERAKLDLSRLTNEIDCLRSKLADLEAHATKIRIYLELAQVYSGASKRLGPLVPNADQLVGKVAGSTVVHRSASGVTAKATEFAVHFIGERGVPQPTQRLLYALEQAGIQIGGQNPIANLSGFLSRDGRLKNSRRHGWGLRSWPEWTAPTSPQTNIESMDQRTESKEQATTHAGDVQTPSIEDVLPTEADANSRTVGPSE